MNLSEKENNNEFRTIKKILFRILIIFIHQINGRHEEKHTD